MIILTFPALFLILLLMFRPMRFVVGWGIVALLCVAAYSCAHANETEWVVVGHAPDQCQPLDAFDDLGFHVPDDVMKAFNNDDFSAEIRPGSDDNIVVMDVTVIADEQKLTLVLIHGRARCLALVHKGE